MRLKILSLAAGVLLLSAGAASAAVVTHDLNLRSGRGTGYRVIDVMPAGAHVAVLGCSGRWCRVNWRGTVGFASASYLAGHGAAYAAPPVYYGPRPVFRFGFGWRGGWHPGRHPVWHHRWHRHR
jgi:uncharacterized protein YraI